jgi:hypothetical protein
MPDRSQAQQRPLPPLRRIRSLRPPLHLPPHLAAPSRRLTCLRLSLNKHSHTVTLTSIPR